jgi:hypothetical protein
MPCFTVSEPLVVQGSKSSCWSGLRISIGPRHSWSGTIVSKADSPKTRVYKLMRTPRRIPESSYLP